MVCDLLNQPDRSTDWSSQNDKSRLESVEELEEINKKKDHEMTDEEGSEEEETETETETETEVACEEDLEEYTEECFQCKKIFKSEEEITKHENDGQECDQCEG